MGWTTNKKGGKGALNKRDLVKIRNSKSSNTQEKVT